MESSLFYVYINRTKKGGWIILNKLQFLECLSERYKLPQILEWRLKNYRTGFIGEGECLLMLLPEITKNWMVLADLNFLLATGRIQIDFMFFSSRKVFYFEDKNLLQNYVYENGI